MKKIKQSKQKHKTKLFKRYNYRLVLFTLGTIVILGLIFLHATGSNTLTLPLKYSQTSSTDSTTILIDGIDPGEGISTLYKNKTITLQTDDLYSAEDLYIVIGENEQATPVKYIKSATDGSINTEFVVPKEYKTGLTSFHVYYTLPDGTTIDRWDEVFVAASKDDYDGDGRKNSSASCNGLVPDSHQDDDHDGKDDACDGYIGPPSNEE